MMDSHVRHVLAASLGLRLVELVMGYVLHCLQNFCSRYPILGSMVGECVDVFYGW